MTSLLHPARAAMQIEAQAILAAAERLGENLDQAVEMILARKGKLIVSGIGKSGHVARKLAATLQSTGTPAVFLHASEAAHGDLGLCQPGDTAVLISKSGSTRELLELVPALKAMGAAFIGILGSVQSPLAREMEVIFDVSVQREAVLVGFTSS